MKQPKKRGESLKAETVAMTLRLPADLREKLGGAVEKSGRSVNAEIEHLLRQCLSGEEVRPATPQSPNQQKDQALADTVIELADWLHVLYGHWSEEPEANAALRSGIDRLLLGAGPKPEIDQGRADEVARIGRDAAETYAEKLMRKLEAIERQSTEKTDGEK